MLSTFAEPPGYRHQMINDNKYRIGDGPRQIPVWLRTEEPVRASLVELADVETLAIPQKSGKGL